VVERPAFVLDISQHWDKKLAAIECYRSQFITGRPTESPTFLDRLRDQAAYWGWSIGTAYGEPFACKEAVGLASLRDLV
jgi:LmbE family N-acetylglucosaminyl deacetylase